MKLIDEISLENVCGGHNIRKTTDAIVTAGLAWIVCSVCAVSSVFLIKDIQKNCNELKKSLTYLRINAIYIIAMRVSFSKEKDKSMLINELIKKDLYKREFTNYLDVRKDFQKFERLILDLIIRNNIKLAIIILNLKNKMKKILSPKEETIKLKKI